MKASLLYMKSKWQRALLALPPHVGKEDWWFGPPLLWNNESSTNKNNQTTVALQIP